MLAGEKTTTFSVEIFKKSGGFAKETMLKNDKILVDKIILIMYNTTRAVLLWRTRKATAAGHTVFRAVEYERTLREGQESAGYY